ncbi:hypothetical protein KURONO_3299 [Mycobacterium tuberculosis str. Kurono]|nr:hypothetical protein KURONO_3299 [Mycobacterium tuberculosis str. Kurono]
MPIELATGWSAKGSAQRTAEQRFASLANVWVQARFPDLSS